MVQAFQKWDSSFPEKRISSFGTFFEKLFLTVIYEDVPLLTQIVSSVVIHRIP